MALIEPERVAEGAVIPVASLRVAVDCPSGGRGIQRIRDIMDTRIPNKMMLTYYLVLTFNAQLTPTGCP